MLPNGNIRKFSFNKDYVNLLKDRTDKAIASRNWLYGELNVLEEKTILFQKLKSKL